MALEIILVDATKQPVEHSQKTAAQYSGKKKCYAKKSQIIEGMKRSRIFFRRASAQAGNTIFLFDADYQVAAGMQTLLKS